VSRKKPNSGAPGWTKAREAFFHCGVYKRLGLGGGGEEEGREKKVGSLSVGVLVVEQPPPPHRALQQETNAGHVHGSGVVEPQLVGARVEVLTVFSGDQN